MYFLRKGLFAKKQSFRTAIPLQWNGSLASFRSLSDSSEKIFLHEEQP